MDRGIEEGAARYKAAQEEGQRLIRQRWTALLDSTKAALVGSGFYSDRGQRLEVEYASGSAPQDDCERLEYALGVFKLCVGSKLPQRTEKGAPIPREAADDEVLSSVGELLYVRAWHDPEFLRMALYGVCMHQKANALSLVGPPSKSSAAWGCVAGAFKLALLLAMPVALAAGLAAATRQDVGLASLAFYVFGAGVLACMSATGVGVKKPGGFELAYDSWTRFQLEGAVGAAGVGALEQLKRMAADGVNVPAMAFDVAEMLRCRMGLRELSESVKPASSVT